MPKGKYLCEKGKNVCVCVKGKYLSVTGKNVYMKGKDVCKYLCVKGKYMYMKGKNVCVKGTYMCAMCKNVCVMGKYVNGKNMCEGQGCTWDGQKCLVKKAGLPSSSCTCSLGLATVALVTTKLG